MYKSGETKKFKSNKEVEHYFISNNIDYTFVTNESPNLFIYLLKRKESVDPAYCVISSEKDRLEIYLTYNVKDTIKSLPRQFIRPFFGANIEN
ncbi:hypothetical protein CMT52_21180 [Elizabethkingia anophelis]|nr:hypothetical protein [Elizabethkingia anophelis]